MFVTTEKLNAGKLEMGQRESVYVHQKKDVPVLTLQLLDETLIEKHHSQTYTVLLQHCTHNTHAHARQNPDCGALAVVPNPSDMGRLRVDDSASLLPVQRLSQGEPLRSLPTACIYLRDSSVIVCVSCVPVCRQSIKWKTNIKLPYPLPGKKLIGSLEDEVVEQRKVGLRQYLKGECPLLVPHAHHMHHRTRTRG